MLKDDKKQSTISETTTTISEKIETNFLVDQGSQNENISQIKKPKQKQNYSFSKSRKVKQIHTNSPSSSKLSDELMSEESLETLKPIRLEETKEKEFFKINSPNKVRSNEFVKFMPHNCNENCIERRTYTLRGLNPFYIPIQFGWRRYQNQFKRGERRFHVVFYRAPCGRFLRNLDEIFKYLKITKSKLDIMFFAFDEKFKLFENKQLNEIFCQSEDIADGKEQQPISCFNFVDKELLTNFTYITERRLHPLLTQCWQVVKDKNFLVCCNCEDDCSDSNKCACQLLTVNSAKNYSEGAQVGYNYKKLNSQVISGIYECNSECKCKKTCLNRIVQNGVFVKLQVYKTRSKGWGVRTLHHIPKGEELNLFEAFFNFTIFRNIHLYLQWTNYFK